MHTYKIQLEAKISGQVVETDKKKVFVEYGLYTEKYKY